MIRGKVKNVVRVVKQKIKQFFTPIVCIRSEPSHILSIRFSLFWCRKCPATGKEYLKKYLSCKEAYDHPLRSNGITVSVVNFSPVSIRCRAWLCYRFCFKVSVAEIRKTGSKTSSRTSSTISLDPLTLDGSDPLSHFARLDSTESDPLTRLGGDHVLVTNFNIQFEI